MHYRKYNNYCKYKACNNNTNDTDWVSRENVLKVLNTDKPEHMDEGKDNCYCLDEDTGLCQSDTDSDSH